MATGGFLKSGVTWITHMYCLGREKYVRIKNVMLIKYRCKRLFALQHQNENVVNGSANYLEAVSKMQMILAAILKMQIECAFIGVEVSLLSYEQLNDQVAIL